MSAGIIAFSLIGAKTCIIIYVAPRNSTLCSWLGAIWLRIHYSVDYANSLLIEIYHEISLRCSAMIAASANSIVAYSQCQHCGKCGWRGVSWFRWCPTYLLIPFDCIGFSLILPGIINEIMRAFQRKSYFWTIILTMEDGVTAKSEHELFVLI